MQKAWYSPRHMGRLIALGVLWMAFATGAQSPSKLNLQATPTDDAGDQTPNKADAGKSPSPLRPEVLKTIIAAQTQIDQKNYTSALTILEEANRVAQPSIFEFLVISRMRATAALGAGQTELAAESVNAAIGAGHVPVKEQIEMIHAVAGLYFRKGNYPAALTWSQREVGLGGGDGASTLLAEIYYRQGNYAEATRTLTASIAADQAKNAMPAQDQLVLLVSCYGQERNPHQQAVVLEQLVALYPSKQYWHDLFSQMQAEHLFSQAQTLDVYELKYSLGTLQTADEFMEMSALALQAGYPAQARNVLEDGFSQHVLGVGEDAEVQRNLLNIAQRRAASDQVDRATVEANALRGHDTQHLLQLGFDDVTTGLPKQGIPLIEAAIRMGGLAEPTDASLKLGIAHLLAGDTEKALALFQSVPLNSNDAILARLWTLRAHES